eukprot:6207256-Pleurochrysis_carterae.AAC.2
MFTLHSHAVCAHRPAFSVVREVGADEHVELVVAQQRRVGAPLERRGSERRHPRAEVLARVARSELRESKSKPDPSLRLQLQNSRLRFSPHF